MATASDLKAFMVRQIEELKLAHAIGGTMAAAYSPEELIIMKLTYYQYGQTERHLEDIVNLLYGLRGNVDLDWIEGEVTRRGLEAPWSAVKLRWREARAASEASKKRPAE